MVFSSIFSVKSFYHALIRVGSPNLNKSIWKIRAPLNIKVFLWYLHRSVLLTKDNLAKRNWIGNSTCCFCHLEETIHLFFRMQIHESSMVLFHCASNIPQPAPGRIQFPLSRSSLSILGPGAKHKSRRYNL
jgi:hypothetical protein